MMAMLNLQQPLLQFSVLHDPSEIILIWYLVLIAQETFLIISNVESSCAAYLCCFVTL